jgi:hypothetical protein
MTPVQVPHLLRTLADCHKARSVSIYDRCKAVYEGCKPRLGGRPVAGFLAFGGAWTADKAEKPTTGFRKRQMRVVLVATLIIGFAGQTGERSPSHATTTTSSIRLGTSSIRHLAGASRPPFVATAP